MGKISLPTELAYFVIPTVENLIFSKMQLIFTLKMLLMSYGC